MAFKIRGSHMIAAAVTIGIAAWMLNGEVEIGGTSQASDAAPTIAERESQSSTKLFRVSYIPLQYEERKQTVPVRGRTKADSIVSVRAETTGIVKERLVKKGERVESGQLVCVLDRGSREASLAQAEAQLAQAGGDYDANKKLAKKGFASKTKMRQMEAALEAAEAAVAQAKLELSRTEIRANADGVVQAPVAQVGDMLSAGGTCVTLVDSDPMLFTGQVSERSIGLVTKGMPAKVSLVTGEEVNGTVRFISPSADPQTRTFTTEIELENTGTVVRDGLTARAEILLPPTPAFRISPSWITLSDTGEIGLKTLDADDKVQFTPITILAQTNNGFWITGPEAGSRVITLGQEYIGTGEKVEPVKDPLLGAGAGS